MYIHCMSVYRNVLSLHDFCFQNEFHWNMFSYLIACFFSIQWNVFFLEWISWHVKYTERSSEFHYMFLFDCTYIARFFGFFGFFQYTSFHFFFFFECIHCVFVYISPFTLHVFFYLRVFSWHGFYSTVFSACFFIWQYLHCIFFILVYVHFMLSLFECICIACFFI